MKLEQILEQLKVSGYKATAPRTLILRILINNHELVLSADEIYLLVKLENEKINRSTVYRNLEILSEENLLYKTITEQGITKVKLRCCDKHHHHLICDMCGKIVVFDQCTSELYNDFAKSNGFILTGHTLELHGICATCQLLKRWQHFCCNWF